MNKMILLPIILVELYLLFTIIFYLTGPIRWRTPNLSNLLLYLFFAFSLLFLGYIFYFFRNKSKISYGSPFALNNDYLIKILKFMLIFNLIVFTLYLIRNLGSNELTWDNIIIWIANPSDQYAEKFNNSYDSFGKFTAALATVSSLFLWPTIPLGLYEFKKINIMFKIMLILNIFVELLRWLAMGTNKGIIDIIIIFICLIFISLIDRKVKFVKKIFIIIISLSLIYLGLYYFDRNVMGRVSNNYQYIMNNLCGNRIDFDNFWIKTFPNLESVIINSNSYFTQGYYGLAHGLNTNWTPMLGAGGSGFLRENIEEALNIDLYQYTYMHKINNVWNEKSNWHTALLWFACDFGFIGTLLLMFIIGYYYAFIINNLINKKNPIFFPLFCIMIQLFFYLPMNNQIFNMPFSFMGFVGMNLFLIMLKHNVLVKHIQYEVQL